MSHANARRRCDDAGMRSNATEQRRPGVFLSVAEVQKASLGRSFRDLLRPAVDGFIVSDLPHPGETYTPEEKVNAYLDRSQAVVVFATADLDTGVDQYTRPNIADEIARARSKPHLQNRICVLKQSGVTLASNTNPVYTRLDPDDPAPAFTAALEQLKAWGFDVDVPDVGGPATAGRGSIAANAPSPAAPSADSVAASLERALALVPRKHHGVGEASLGLIVVAAPREAVLRPSELEDPALAGWLEREALYGEPPVLERGEGTKTGVSAGALVARQSRASVALDEEGAVVVARQLKREAERSISFQGIIEEDVLADLIADLAFVDRVLAHIDQARRISHVIPVAILLGAGYSAWRTRAEQAASPGSMTLNIRGGDEIVTRLSSPAQSRSVLTEGRSNLATDLMVLLRRAAREGS
jgi:hypothetical protein